MKRLLPALLALTLLSGCGARETASSLPETSPAQQISAPAVVTEGREPEEDDDLSAALDGFSEWMHNSTLDQNSVGLLAELPEQDVALYGVRDHRGDDRALLRWEDSLAEFDWNFGGPLTVEPRLWCWDADDDGQDEVVLVNHVGSGTGVSIEELHIVEKNEDGTLADYAFPEELWRDQLSALLTLVKGNNRVWVSLGRELVDITSQLPENLEPETLRGLGTGNVAGFDTDWPRGADIRFSGSVCLDADGYNSWYVADISAYVSYAGSVFTLSDLHLNSN